MNTNRKKSIEDTEIICKVIYLCNPFNSDRGCALFSLLSYLKTNSTPQREAPRRSGLKGLQRLLVNYTGVLNPREKVIVEVSNIRTRGNIYFRK